MKGRLRVEPILRGLTAVALAVALGAILWPTTVPEVELAPAGFEPPPGARPAARPAAAGDAATARKIVEGNIFSHLRAAPAVRWRPLGPAIPAGEAVGPAPVGSGGDEVPRLLGTLVDGSGPAALLRLDPASPGSRLYRVGERGGRYRVESITEQAVVLIGPQGRIELRLPHPDGALR